jgi:hypothetical protein
MNQLSLGGTVANIGVPNPTQSWFANWMTSDPTQASPRVVLLWSLCIAAMVFLGLAAAMKKASQPIAWQSFHSTGGYTVQMPGAVTENTLTKTVLGHEIVAWEVHADDHSRDCGFAAGYHDTAAGMRFDAVRAADEFAQKTGKMLMETPIMVDGHYGQEVVIRTSDQHTVTARWIEIGNRVFFVLQSITDRASADADVQAFIPSFHFDTAGDGSIPQQQQTYVREIVVPRVVPQLVPRYVPRPLPMPYFPPSRGHQRGPFH